MSMCIKNISQYISKQHYKYKTKTKHLYSKLKYKFTQKNYLLI